MKVSGLIIAERFYSPDEKIYYSLGVLDRFAASEPYRHELRQYKEDYHKYFQSALQHRKSGKISQAILCLKDAYQSAVKFNEVFASYKILAGPAALDESVSSEQLSAAVILNALSEIVSGLYMEIAEGDNQKFMIGKPLPSPLGVRVMLKDEPPIPVEGLSISFQFKAGNGELLPSTVQTNSEGLVFASITRVEPSGDKEQIVSASLHLNDLLDYSGYGEEWNKRIPARLNEILFNMRRKKAPESTKVLVLLRGADLNPLGEGAFVIRDRLFQHLTDSGFSPTDGSEISGLDTGLIGKISQNMGSESLRRQLSNIAVVVFVEANLANCSYTQGMKVCGVTGTARAVTVDKGSAIATKSFQNIRGFGITGTQAAENAYKNAADQVAEPLINDILEMYVSPKKK